MNDFERKLSEQAFRAPSPDLREAIFARVEVAVSPTAPAIWTWRDWFWPSPQAWAALAALWMVFATLAVSDHPATVELTSTPALPPPPTATLLSYHTNADLKHVLDLAN